MLKANLSILASSDRVVESNLSRYEFACKICYSYSSNLQLTSTAKGLVSCSDIYLETGFRQSSNLFQGSIMSINKIPFIILCLIWKLSLHSLKLQYFLSFSFLLYLKYSPGKLISNMIHCKLLYKWTQIGETGFTAIDIVQVYRRNVHGRNITHV